MSGVAVALKQAMSPEFKAYQMQVLTNCKALSSALIDHGYKIVTGEFKKKKKKVHRPKPFLSKTFIWFSLGGSDNHLILLNLRNKGTDGGRAEKVLEACAIACNKNTCPGRVSRLLSLLSPCHIVFTPPHILDLHSSS